MRSELLARLAGVEHGFLPPGGRPAVPFWRPHQVHGARVVPVRTPDELRESADGAFSLTPGLAAAVVTADCAPVLLATTDGAAVAAVHAGWRGLAAGVVEEGVRQLRLARPGAEIAAAIGPAAGGCCYEVGPEVLAQLDPEGDLVAPTDDGHAKIDLRGLVRARLLASGLPPTRIEVVGPCTICSDLPSYRRQGKAAGRILSYVSPAAAPDAPRGA